MLHYYKKKRKIEPITIVFIFFSLLLVGSVAYLLIYFYQGDKNRGKQEDLNNLLSDIDSNTNGEDRYASIRDKYPYLVGRIKFNYYKEERFLPIMQTKNDPEHFLYRDPEGEDSKWGTPFLDYRCDIKKPSANLIVYGHNMKDLSQFGSLSEYKSQDYYKKYPTMKLETMYEEEKIYDVVASMHARIYDKGMKSVFKYYNFVDATNASEFNNFVSNIKKMQCYETGIVPQYGDKLLTLSTCDYTKYADGGRFVVVLRKRE